MERKFLMIPVSFTDYENSRIVVLPVPYEKTSSWMKGSKRGPAAIIGASRYLELYDIETNSEVYKEGIYTHRPLRCGRGERMVKTVKSAVLDLLEDGKFVVVLGGEHTVSAGVVAAFAERFTDIGVLHLDAHTDLRDTYRGDRYSHACAMARVREYVETVVSVGIRSMDSGELGRLEKGRVFFAGDINGSADWMERVVAELPERVYVSLDLDVFDPGVLPSVGTPEPGGLDWYAVTKLLKTVTEKREIVGADIVELCPARPRLKSRASDFLAAKLVYTLLSYKFSQKKNERGS